ncbi:PaeR7I family type II restriction endonuclease [Paenarthrobacter sp. TE4293]|uniref:PaeR7I family type II restriction endonuclease n=1 Tax=Paenarthrobacter sp. TE4293 TaxID=3381695 RepID=UPI003D253864
MTKIGVHLHPQGEHFFWETRERAEAACQDSDRGGRADATAGKDLDGFVQIFAYVIKKLKIECLVAGTETRYFTLPGYLRPVKYCDLVLTRGGELLVLLEFKCH